MTFTTNLSRMLVIWYPRLYKFTWPDSSAKHVEIWVMGMRDIELSLLGDMTTLVAVTKGQTRYRAVNVGLNCDFSVQEIMKLQRR